MRNQFLFLFVFVFLISFSSAILEVGVVDERLKEGLEITDSAREYPAISVVTNWDLPLISSTKADLVLTNHDASCGVDCISVFNIFTYDDSPLVDNVKFYTLNGDDRVLQNIRSYQFYIKTEVTEIVVPDYENVCDVVGYDEKNGSEIYECNQREVGSHTELTPEWTPYNIGDRMPSGLYTIKLEGQKRPDRAVDWIIETQGKAISEWATWGNISAGSQAEVILNSPANNNVSYTNLITFSALANVTGGSYLTNISLWTNQTGTWALKNTTSGLNITGLLSYYSLDETSGTFANDSLKRYNLSINDNVVINREGKVNTGYYFYPNGFLNTSTKNDLDLRGNFTINLWLNRNSSNINEYIIARDCGSAVDCTQFVLESNPTDVTFRMTETASHKEAKSVRTYDNATWYMITAKLNQTHISIYHNGVLANATAFNANNQYVTNTLTTMVGRRENGVALMTSYLDEIGIWNRSISDSEITDLYNSGLGKGYLGTTITKNFTNTYPIPSNTLWNVQACDSDGVCGFALSNRTVYVTFAENTQTYNSSTYETAQETFSSNISYESDLYSISAHLIYNGTTYDTTISGTGDNINFTKTIDIGTVSAITNNSFYWSYILTNNTDSTTTIINSTAQNQTVNPIIFQICNATYTTTYLNISFKNDTLAAQVVNGTIISSWQYWLGGGTYKKDYSFTNATENRAYSFCASPTDKTYNIYADVTYANSASPQRVWTNTTTYTNTTTQKILYLLPLLSGQYVSFTVQDISTIKISGALINIKKSSDGTPITSDYTDDSGIATFFLDPLISYNVNVYKDGYENYTTTIAPSAATYTVTLTSLTGLGGGTSFPDPVSGISLSFSPTTTILNNATSYDFKMTISDLNSNLDSYGFTLTDQNNNTIGSKSGTTAAGEVLTLSKNTSNYTYIYMNWNYVINGNTSSGVRIWLIVDPEGSDWSIKNFFDDLNGYTNETSTGLFGIKKGTPDGNFTLSLLIFLIVFFVGGIMSYKFGMTSSTAIIGAVFAVVLFFDVGVGLLPDIVTTLGTPIPHLATIFMGVVLFAMFIKEAYY